MKGESNRRWPRAGRRPLDPEAVAIQVLARLADDPDRLGRFLALTGLDPGSLRGAARDGDLLRAVLDHVAADEALLLAIAAEIGEPPEAIAQACQALSPPGDFDP